MVADSQWIVEIVDVHIYETAEKLTAETVAAAERRGQAR